MVDYTEMLYLIEIFAHAKNMTLDVHILSNTPVF